MKTKICKMICDFKVLQKFAVVWSERQFNGPRNLNECPRGMKGFLNTLCLGDLLTMSEDDVENLPEAVNTFVEQKDLMLRGNT